MITFNKNPITLFGQLLSVGMDAPDFILTDNSLNKKSLKDFPGKKLISVVPSLDTGVCDIQTRKFNTQAKDLGGTVLTVSVDLPFAQARWCGASGFDNVVTLSDYYNHNFGKAYGVLIEELHLLTRAIFVVDANNKISYVQYVPEVTDEPDYDSAINNFKSLA